MYSCKVHMEKLSRQTYVLIVIQIPTRITAKTANIILIAMRPVLEMLTAQVRFLVPTAFLCVIFSIVNQYFPYHFYTWEKVYGKKDPPSRWAVFLAILWTENIIPMMCAHFGSRVHRFETCAPIIVSTIIINGRVHQFFWLMYESQL